MAVGESKLISPPTKGQIVKVYIRDRWVRYGVAKGLSKEAIFSLKGKLLTMQQTVILDEIEQPEFEKIDYFYDSEKVTWNKIFKNVDIKV